MSVLLTLETLRDTTPSVISLDELKVVSHNDALADHAVSMFCAARLNNQSRELFAVRPAEPT